MPAPGSPEAYPGHPDAHPGRTAPGSTVEPARTFPRLRPDGEIRRSPPMRDRWAFVVGPASGGLDRELTGARGRKIVFKLTDQHDASCELRGDDPDATQITELSTDLHAFRRPRPGVARECLFRGRIGASSDRITENDYVISFPALDYRAVLRRRRLMNGSQQTWTDQDQLDVAWGLLGEAQNKVGGNYGIVRGVGTSSGIKITRTFDLGDEIGMKIQELSEVDNGFDWDIVPTGTEGRGLALDLHYPRRGVDRGVILQHGRAARTLTREVDPSDFANAIRMTGKAPDGGGAGPTPHEAYAADLASAPEGRWDTMIGTDLTTASAVKARIDWQLGESQTVRPSYTCDLIPGWWGGPSHVWLGDPVRMIIRRGRLNVSSIMRVHEIDVTIDDDGDERIALILNAPRPDPRKRATDVERRLAELERR